MYDKMIIILFLIIPMARSHVPGTFFWKPRLALDLSIPSTSMGYGDLARMPKKENIYAGLIVLVDGYVAGMTILSIAAGASSATTYVHLNPLSAYYYTTMYRWMLRYLALVPHWTGGHGGNFVETHKVWKRRYYYLDEFMPEWMKKCLPFVKKEEWDQEVLDWKRFKKYSESAFGKHYRYPTKAFNNFKSQMTVETAEVNYQEVSSESL